MSETPKNLISIVADWFKKHPLVTQAGSDLIYGGLVANALLPLIAAQGEMEPHWHWPNCWAMSAPG